MRYAGATAARLGDGVRLWPGVDGVVVCSLDTCEFSETGTESDWGCLKQGVLVESPQAGRIHYLDRKTTMTLLDRRPLTATPAVPDTVLALARCVQSRSARTRATAISAARAPEASLMKLSKIDTQVRIA